MLCYAKLSKIPSVFRSFTGLRVNEFDSVLSAVEEVYPSIEERRLSKDERQREIGAGHPFKLPLRDRLLMLLTYYRLYVTSTLLGFLFDLGQTNVLKDIRIVEPALKDVLPLPEKLYRRTTTKRKKIGTIEELEKLFPGLRAIIDSTEQEIPRPKKDKEKRKTHYSGKKRKHTVKTQLTVNSNGLIIHRTNHARGRRHDLDLYKEHHPSLPKEVQHDFDRGYDGVKKYFPDLECAIPFKRRAGGKGTRDVKAPDLTPEQKAFNTHLSKERVVVEHTISRMKKFRVMADEFRNRLRHYDAMTNIVSGLVNLRILGSVSV
jgi:hypothetical protein